MDGMVEYWIEVVVTERLSWSRGPSDMLWLHMISPEEDFITLWGQFASPVTILGLLMR